MIRTIKITLLALLFIGLTGANDCDRPSSQPKSASGVVQASVKVKKNAATGLTIEQENVRERLLRDNTPGSIKHLYVISAFSGDVILYSTVKGKVTSSGKRLTPTSVWSGRTVNYGYLGPTVSIGGEEFVTNEVLEDDGTYGSSIPYIYWFDSKDIYHQHYVSGGQIIHVSEQPLRVGKVLISVDGPS